MKNKQTDIKAFSSDDQSTTLGQVALAIDSDKTKRLYLDIFLTMNPDTDLEGAGQAVFTTSDNIDVEIRFAMDVESFKNTPLAKKIKIDEKLSRHEVLDMEFSIFRKVVFDIEANITKQVSLATDEFINLEVARQVDLAIKSDITKPVSLAIYESIIDLKIERKELTAIQLEIARQVSLVMKSEIARKIAKGR